MRYYHIWVKSEQFRSAEALTYSYDGLLAPGAIVEAPLRDGRAYGFVMSPTAKPRFQTKPLLHVYALPPLPGQSLRLAEWIMRYYPSPIGVITRLFLPGSLPKKTTLAETVLPQDVQDNTHQQYTLTSQQQAAIDGITTPDTYLLHGRTGSGKTQIYIELARRSLKQGKSIIVLSPEIGLTSQIALNFRHVFAEQVVILHSQLTDKERTSAWLKVLNTEEPVVVIGPRSTLFCPLRNIGLIVVDEAHDQAYKQEQPPYYQATRVASQLRALHDAILVLGSATPLITDYYLAQQRQKPIIRLDALAKASNAERHITIVDLKNREQFSKSPYLSTSLIQAIQQSLEKNEQSLLYLNRRGTARVTLCNNCGWQAICPNCDVPLTYHGDSFMLKCHICGYQAHAPVNCPDCGNPSIEFRSFGTKAIAEEAKRLFPEARTWRLDTDSQKSDRLESKYEQIVSGDVDILVGTQLLAKGLDLPRLSTLGIVMADSSLYLPDYTATERTYQLLTQVIGRIGRGHLASRAVIQTYQSERKLLQYALQDDWDNFYNNELIDRKHYLFPPFCHLLKLSCKRSTVAAAEKAAQRLKDILTGSTLPLIVDGPAPAFHEKVNGQYRWQLVVKARERGALLRAITLLPAGWSYDLDPADLL